MTSFRKVGELKTPFGEGSHPQGCVTSSASDDKLAHAKKVNEAIASFVELRLEDLVPNQKQVRRKHQWPRALPKFGKFKRTGRKKAPFKSTSGFRDLDNWYTFEDTDEVLITEDDDVRPLLTMVCDSLVEVAKTSKLNVRVFAVVLCKVFVFLRASKKFSADKKTLLDYCELLSGMFASELFDLFNSFFPELLNFESNEVVSCSFVTELLETSSNLLQNPHVKRVLRVLGLLVGAAIARVANMKVDSTRLLDLWESFIGGARGLDAVSLMLEFSQWLFSLFLGEGSRLQTLFCGHDTQMIKNMSRAAELLSSSGHPRLNADGRRSLTKLRTEVDKLSSYFLGELKAKRNKAFANMYYKSLVEYSEKLRILITSSRPKEQPYCLFLSGAAGQGKSALTNLLIRAIEGHSNFLGTRGKSEAEADDIRTQETFMHNCSASKYLSGYQSQKVIVFEDMCNSLQTGKGDSSPLDFLIGAVNNNTVFTNQAEVEAKGSVPYAAELVIVSSNTTDLMANQLSASPYSIARRLHRRIVPTLVEEPTGGIDPNNWRIQVFRPERTPLAEGVSRNKDGFVWVPEGEFNYNEFMEYILADYDAHQEVQKRFMESVSLNSRYCPRGQLLSVCPHVCRCEDVEGAQSTSSVHGTYWVEISSAVTRFLSWVMLVCTGVHPWLVFVFQFSLTAFSLFLTFCAGFYCGSFQSLGNQFLTAYAVARGYVRTVTFLAHKRLYRSLVPPKRDVVVKGSIVVVALGAILLFWRNYRKQTSTMFWSKSNPGALHHGQSVQGASPSLILERVKDSVRRVETRYGDRLERCVGFMLQSFALLVPKHAIRAGQTINVVRVQQGVTLEVSVLLDDKSLFLLEGDLALVVSRNLGTSKSLASYFPTSFIVGDRPAFLLVGDQQKEIRLEKTRRVVTDKADFVGVMYHTKDGSSINVGTSGSLVVDFDKNAPLGVSLASNEGSCGFFQMITKETVEKCKDYLSSILRSDFENCVEMPETFEGVTISTKEIHPKSHLHFIEKSCHVPVGNCHRRTKAKTSVRLSEVSHLFLDNPAHTTFAPPALTGDWRDYLKTRGMIERGVSTFPLSLLSEAATVRSREIREKCSVKYPPLTLNQVVCGVENEPLIDHMELATSAGCPHYGPKSQFVLYKLNEHGEQVFDRMSDDQQQTYDTFIGKLERGEPIPCLFTATKKDEVLKTGKIPRTFYASSLAVIMLVRRYFAPVLQALKSEPIHAEIAIGMNAFGKDWTELYSYLASFSTDNVIAGDYGSFDMTHNADAVRCAMQVFLDMIDDCELYSDADKIAARTLVESLCQSFLAFDGTWLQIIGWVLSGIPLTAELNSILNQIYMRLVWKHITGRPMEEFRKHVGLTTYGDDHVGAVRDEPRYNFATVAQAMQHFGMVYTNTSKTDEVHIYEKLDEVEYLKRRFVPGPLKVYAPLRLSSVDKRIVWSASRAPDRVRSVIYSVAIDCIEHQFEGVEYWKNFCRSLCSEPEVEGQVPYLHLVEGDPVERLFEKVNPEQLSSEPFWHNTCESDDWTAYARSKLPSYEKLRGGDVSAPQSLKAESSYNSA